VTVTTAEERAELGRALAQARMSVPGAVQGWGLGDDKQPPTVHIAAWADRLAAELHVQFPSLIVTLGFRHYPDPTKSRARKVYQAQSSTRTVESSRLLVALDGALTVQSGHSAEHGLLLTNVHRDSQTLDTNGRVIAYVVDPETHRTVGVSTTGQALPLVRFVIESGTTMRIPLLIGTDSVDPRLGFKVPPGTWLAQATLSISGRNALTPLMPFTVSQ
jgi:hypothetical protein